jgi:hypothetical protein
MCAAPRSPNSPTREHTLPAILYLVGFIAQVAGAALVAAGIRDDRREAERIALEALPVTWETADAVGRAFVEYLALRQVQRWLGVALIIIGAGIGLAGNLTALS